jgi:hypothetical protein
MPYNPYNKYGHFDAAEEENRKKFRKARNRAMNNIFSKYGIPKNMGNKEIKRRVNYHSWVARKLLAYGRYGSSGQTFNPLENYKKNGDLNAYTKFLMNDKFTENKRKSLVVLSIQLGDYKRAVLSVRNPVVVSYLMKLMALFGQDYLYKTINKRDWYSSNFLGQLKLFGKYREDAAMIAVLKKRINFLKKIKNHGPANFYPNNLLNNLKKLNINISLDYYTLNPGILVIPQDVKKIMDKMFPIPPHPKDTAATTIQKRARGMINRTTVKKMKTVAGRVSLRGKRKKPPQ